MHRQIPSGQNERLLSLDSVTPGIMACAL